MPDINVTSKIEGLDDDINTVEKEVEAQIPVALNYVGSEMVDNLQEHIRVDWYEAWGDPKEYQRRTDYGGGTPLGSALNMDITVRDEEMEFSYLPSGDHVETAWDEREGDMLIQVIQSDRGWSYPVDKDTEGRTIMPRPFWDNFVDDQEARVVDSFIAGMHRNDIVKEASDRHIDLSEYKRLGTSTISDKTPKHDTNGDDDLPY